MTTWNIDPAHSEINFKARHLLVSTVTGHFDKFSATIEADAEDFSDGRVSFEADTASVSTKNEQRDAHLKSPDFFDAASDPKMTFVSTGVRKHSEHEYKVDGNLTIRNVTRPITLDVIYNGAVQGFGGIAVAGFEIRAKINRFDFGLQWNALTEAGGVVVSNEIKIEILAEFNRQEQIAKAA